MGVAEVAGYGEDDDFMAGLRAAARTDEDMARWMVQWMTEPADHSAYLERLGEDRLTTLRADVHATPAGFDTAAPARDERMTLTAIRVLRDRIVGSGTNLVLAGIGYSHLAAWTAVSRLRDEGVEVELP